MFDWIVSDTHWFHDNIIRYSGRPANHNELMVENWNRVVKPTDTVLHLGDVLMGPQFRWQELPRLNGIVSVLKSGNHDEEHKRKFIEEEWGWNFVPEFRQHFGRWEVFFTHVPIGQDHPNWKTLLADEINIHGHVHEKPDPSSQHINVSVERINYRPVWLSDILQLRIRRLENG